MLQWVSTIIELFHGDAPAPGATGNILIDTTGDITFIRKTTILLKPTHMPFSWLRGYRKSQAARRIACNTIYITHETI